MEIMGIVEEWSRSLPSENTRKHHERGLRYFTEFLGESPETILKERRKQHGESKYFETQVLEFFRWLQKERKLSQNSSRSYVIGVQSFFSYYNVPLQLKRKLPNLHMKLDERKLSPEDLGALFRYNDLTIKLWISLSKDCPARISDLLKLRRKQIKSEFLIQSRKENVTGKIFLSEETIELFHRFWETVPKSEWAFCTPTGDRYTPNGVRKLLRRASEKAGLKDLNLHQHMFRKLFFTVAVNSGIPEMVLKILMFKSVPADMLTYYLDRDDLRDYWEKIVDQMSLEPRINNRVGDVMKTVDMMKETLTTLEKENMVLKTRIDNLQENAIKVETRLDGYEDFILHYIEFGPLTEEEKKALRRKLNITKDFSPEMKGLLHDFNKISTELQKEKGYLDKKDDKELTRRFEAKIKKRAHACMHALAKVQVRWK